MFIQLLIKRNIRTLSKLKIRIEVPIVLQNRFQLIFYIFN